MNLSPQNETFLQDNQTWLGSAHGTSSAESATLDLTTFVAPVHYPNGYLPSGLPLAKITESGKFGPYNPTDSPVVSTTDSSLDVTATTGTFDPSDEGAPVTGSGIPAGTTIASVTDSTHAVLSEEATATATGVTLTIGASDGLQTLAGFLLTPVRVIFYGSGAVMADAHGALLVHGRVIAANLPIPVDAAGIADVAGSIIFS